MFVYGNRGLVESWGAGSLGLWEGGPHELCLFRGNLYTSISMEYNVDHY